MPPHPRIVDAVFEQRHSRHPVGIALGIAGAIAFHALLWIWALTRGPALEAWSTELALRLHEALSRQDVVEIAKPPPPPPKPPPPPARIEPPKVPRVAFARARPPPPAKAGNVLARRTSDDAPVDLTADTFVTGTSKAYVGGTTSSSGTNEVAVHTTVTDPTARPTRDPKEPDLSRSVSLDDDQWHCPWPQEADAAEIDQQAVVIRVAVKPDGIAARVDLLTDPGHGFGAAARNCALRTRFEPAKDKDGNRIAAVSPPIRVRFTR